MRLVVLLCGVIAGIVGLGFAWWGEPGALVDIFALPTPLFAASVLAIHAVSAMSIAGGLLILANPRVGGMLMLASASVWLLIVALLGGGLNVSMAALIAIGGGGGILAFLPSLSRAAYRLAPAHEDEQLVIETRDTSRASAAEAPRPRSIETPASFASYEEAAEGHVRPVYEEPADAEPLAPLPDDFFSPRSDEPTSYNWRSSFIDTTEDHSKPFQPTQWRFEAPDAPLLHEEDLVDEPPAPPPPPPRTPLREPPPPIEPQPWLSREDLDERSSGYEIHHGHIRPLTLKTPRRRRSPAKAAAGIIALAVLLVGLPILLVIDHQQRSATDATPTAATGAVVSTAKTADPAPASPAPAAVAPARLDAGALPAIEASAPAPARPLSALPLPLGARAALYQTPFDYCESEVDVDRPQLSMVAVGLPDELIAGVREVTKIADADVLWRCMSGRIWVCAQPPGGTACGKVPTPAEREAYCAANPGATNIAAAAGTWGCEGTRPVVPGGDQRTTDARGYDRMAWLGLTRTLGEG